MQNRKKAPAGMYSAKEAIAVIGIPTSSFYNLVRAGKITSVVLQDRKEAYYPKQDIDRYARAYHSYISRFSEHTIHFGLALAEDIPEIRTLVAQATGGYEHTVPQGVMEAWIRKNPEALHVLWRGTEIVGYCSMFPLPLETIMKRMTGEYWNRTIPIDDIQPYKPGAPIRLYIAEAVVKQDAPESRQLGARLLEEIDDFLIDLTEQGITIFEIYAVGTSPSGIQLCRRLGMEALDLPEGTRADRVPFRLEIARNRSQLVQRYRTAVERFQHGQAAPSS